jgi:hypothetical protein
MKESNSVEEHIRNMCKLQEQINLAINEQGGDKIKELHFIRQVVASPPNSWEIFISVLDFKFNNTNNLGGLLMSKRIQNKLLAEDLRRKSKSNSSFFTTGSSATHSHCRQCNNQSQNGKRAIDSSKIICNNFKKPRHIARNCRTAGGGTWKRDQNRKEQNTDWANQDKSCNPNKPNNNKNKGKQCAYNAEETDEFAVAIIEEVSNPGLQIPVPDKANPGLQTDMCDRSDHCLLNPAQVPDDLISTQPPGGLWETANNQTTQTSTLCVQDEITNNSAYTTTEANKNVLKYTMSSWIIDTAATCHIGNKAKLFKKLQPHTRQVLGMGRHTQIHSIGDIQLQIQDSEESSSTAARKKPHKLTLKDTYYVPNTPVNLISLSKLTDGLPEAKIIIKKNEMKFYNGNSDLLAIARKAGTRKTGNSWHLTATIESLNYAYVACSLSDWHLILGHVNTQTILNMVNQGLAKGIEITKKTSRNLHIDCIGCTKGKATVRPFKKTDKLDLPREIGAMIYSNMWGPARTASIQGNEYMISFTNSTTRYTRIYFMKHKNEVFDRYLNTEAWLKIQFSKPIKQLHYHGGKELIHQEFHEHCTKNGTSVTTTAPHSSSQNGIVENLNRRYAKKACALMQANPNTTNKPYQWREAMEYVNCIKNCTLMHIGSKYISPYQALYGKLLDLSHYQMWGATCQVLIQDNKNKIGTRTKTAIFTSIEDTPLGTWRYLALPHRAIQTSRNVYFQTRLPNPATSNEGEPIGLSKEQGTLDNEDFIEVTPLIKGRFWKDLHILHKALTK